MPISRFLFMDMAAGSRPASCMAFADDPGLSCKDGEAEGFLANAVGADHAHSSDNHPGKRH